jgi:hypothetical protein
MTNIFGVFFVDLLEVISLCTHFVLHRVVCTVISRVSNHTDNSTEYVSKYEEPNSECLSLKNVLCIRGFGVRSVYRSSARYRHHSSRLVSLLLLLEPWTASKNALH